MHEPTYASCSCFSQTVKNEHGGVPVEFHREIQDLRSQAWNRLVDLVDAAAADQRTKFEPFRDLSREDCHQIVTLPPTIAKLKLVRELNLYGSHLVRIPPQIGEMTSLESLDLYCSYRLHWFPYEITHCKKLKKSTVSTRALYGNYKYRPAFPLLRATLRDSLPTRPCTICRAAFEDQKIHQVWISLRVATDVLPLLVNACSEECLKRLPAPEKGYVISPHRGGPDLEQPPP